jgi:hypothetical protein
MGLGKNQLAVSRLTPQSLQMLSALPVNLDELIQQDRATVVFADTVNVRSKVTSKGNNVTIVCRVLIFDKNGKIDTTGSPGQGFEPGIAQEGPHDPGAVGVDGRSGAAGAHGGKVIIHAGIVVGTPNIVSTGGKGGRAEDGGRGRKGLTGPAGAVVKRKSRDTSGINGGEGRPGGSGGLPGYRAPGGSGGDVSLFTLETPPAWMAESSGGQPSDPASPGAPGAGGDPGPAGRLEVETKVCESTIWDSSPGSDYLTFETMADDAEAERPMSANDAAIGHLLLSAHQLRGLDDRPFSARDLLSSIAHSEPFREPPIGRPICRWEVTEVISGNQGGSGAPGPSRDSEVIVRNAEPAAPIAGQKTLKQVSDSEYAAVTPDVWLELLMLSTENDYRRSGLSPSDELRGRVAFLMRICSSLQAPTLIQKEILGRSYAMARKLALGLDFYGYSLERVPLLSFAAYRDLLSNVILPQAKTIEKAFIDYWNESQSAEQRRATVRLSMNEAIARKGHIETLYTDGKNSTKRHLQELDALDSRVDASFQALMKAHKALDNAIERKTEGGCKLLGTLVAVGTIVAGVATGGSALLASASAGVKLWNDLSATDGGLKGLWKNRSILEGDLKKIGDEAGTVAESIKSIQDAVAQLNDEQKKLPQFRMERREFDRVAKDFAELRQAELYKEAGYDYLAVVETRNQAIVDYNALLIQLIELRVQLNSAERVVDGLESAINAHADPAEAYLVSMMSRLYLDTLSMTAQLIHAERKALNYNFGHPADAPVSALNVADLAASFVANQIRWVNWKEQAKRKQRLVPGQLKLDLSKLVTSDMWGTFKRTGLLAFTIRHDHEVYAPIFDWLPGLRLTGFKLALEGARTAPNQPYLPVILTHLGGERIYLADGSINSFSHRTTQYRGLTPVEAAQGDLLDPDFSEDGLYAGVSPFANWLLQFSNHANLRLDLSGLRSAVLEVNGYMIDG